MIGGGAPARAHALSILPFAQFAQFAPSLGGGLSAPSQGWGGKTRALGALRAFWH